MSPILFAVYIDGLVKKVCGKSGSILSVILYADDILLLTPTIYLLQQLLRLCETELIWLDMLINAKKSCCMRIGPRFNVHCEPILTMSGDQLPWVNELRYLGVFIVSSRHFKCSLAHAKRSFYRASNAIFGKIGRVASEEVVLELLTKKCFPALLYGLEACCLNKSEEKSLNFPCVRFLMKLFRTSNYEIIQEVCEFFGLSEPSVLLKKRKTRFLLKYKQSANLICKVCSSFTD